MREKSIRKKELDHFISRAVKAGRLDGDLASSMTYAEKRKYLEWSERLNNEN